MGSVDEQEVTGTELFEDLQVRGLQLAANGVVAEIVDLGAGFRVDRGDRGSEAVVADRSPSKLCAVAGADFEQRSWVVQRQEGVKRNCVETLEGAVVPIGFRGALTVERDPRQLALEIDEAAEESSVLLAALGDHLVQLGVGGLPVAIARLRIERILADD